MNGISIRNGPKNNLKFVASSCGQTEAHRVLVYVRLTQMMIFRSKPPDMKPDPSGSHEIAVTGSV